ncbi:hypothetical protein Xen7305DRAFT_00015240 [Xenococcus sp. PCC 7305]|uniref:hypothetical protein n=1 Tax=Xenococcus sp. PCC 7305 TaxID=102125 RepID=UPI0002ACCE58|nr:hypothetical protein [Xenococcus sp. PCC 7305]ELS01818.1 hypothetical protein Xen7305DRAFT_00015240 [Xenococcus sp. PCC 7305]
MKNPLSQIAIALGLGVAVAFSLASTARSQYVDPNDQGYQSGEKDALYGDGITGINPMDLIHRANLSGGLSAEEFNEQSQGQIQNSAAEYRRLQQERILQQYRNQNEVEGAIVE